MSTLFAMTLPGLVAFLVVVGGVVPQSRPPG